MPEFHIVPNMARMQTAGVTILDLVNAVQASNIIDSPGLYEANHQLILGLVGAQAHDAEQLGRLGGEDNGGWSGCPGFGCSDGAERSIARIYGGHGEWHAAVLLNVTRQPSSNTVAVADAVAAKVQQLRKILPPGVQLEPYYDQSELVRESIRSVRDAILIGLVLACIILFLFLSDWTSSLVAGLVIPVTVAITILFHVGHRRELQSDDPGRPGGCDWTGDR